LARKFEDFLVSKFLGLVKYPYNSIRKRDFSDKKTGKSFGSVISVVGKTTVEIIELFECSLNIQYKCTIKTRSVVK